MKIKQIWQQEQPKNGSVYAPEPRLSFKCAGCFGPAEAIFQGTTFCENCLRERQRIGI